MQTAIEVIEQILQHGADNAKDTCVKVPKMQDFAHSDQGDVIFWKLPELPLGVISAKPVLQLAPGTSRGSRHCIAQDSAHLVEFYALPSPNPLRGTVLCFKGDVIIEHPEHGNQVFDAGIYLVSFQRRHADEIKRIQD